MTLAELLAESVRACFTGLYIESHEHEDALRDIAQLCARENWNLATWNVATGLNIDGATSESASSGGGGDPLAAIQALSALGSDDSAALLVLVNFHRFLSSAEIVRAQAQQISTGKQNCTFVVILSPVVLIPMEPEKLFAVIEHDLPDREQLQEIAGGIATNAGDEPFGFSGFAPATARRIAVLTTRLRQEPILQGSGQRDRPAHVALERRQSDGFPCRPE